MAHRTYVEGVGYDVVSFSPYILLEAAPPFPPPFPLPPLFLDVLSKSEFGCCSHVK